jgi:hypothetical protein
MERLVNLVNFFGIFSAKEYKNPFDHAHVISEDLRRNIKGNNLI